MTTEIKPPPNVAEVFKRHGSIHSPDARVFNSETGDIALWLKEAGAELYNQGLKDGVDIGRNGMQFVLEAQDALIQNERQQYMKTCIAAALVDVMRRQRLKTYTITLNNEDLRTLFDQVDVQCVTNEGQEDILHLTATLK